MNAYRVLGAPPGAGPDDVREAWRRRALETHPDRGGDPVAFHLARRAFERLSGVPAPPTSSPPLLVRHMGPPALARRWWRRRRARVHQPRVA
ncbi:MAG: J domain-containing protein [Acidimicrobiales bacterium]